MTSLSLRSASPAAPDLGGGKVVDLPTTSRQSTPEMIGEAPATATALLRIDLGAVAENWHRLSAVAGRGCEVAAVVKADSYGLGMKSIARVLAEAGCRLFFVAVPDEAIDLAELLATAFPDCRVALLSGPLAGTAAELASHRAIVPVVNNERQLADWQRAAPGRPVILQVDSGMARDGFAPRDFGALVADLARVPVSAVMSHLACADDAANPMNELQRDRFAQLSALLPGIPRTLVASAGLFLGPSFRFDIARCGAALYGLNPTLGASNPMRPVVELKARILQTRWLETGDTVGYGATHKTHRRSRIATLGTGYADGVLRTAGNRACCSIGNHSVPVVGRISMDLVTVDVTDVPETISSPGMFVTMIDGSDGVDRMAQASGTIGYEILTRLGNRFHRVYHGGSN